jgi:hypothetical protein
MSAYAPPFQNTSLARDDFAVSVDAALDAERAGMFGDLVEHFSIVAATFTGLRAIIESARPRPRA